MACIDMEIDNVNVCLGKAGGKSLPKHAVGSIIRLWGDNALAGTCFLPII